MSHPIPTPNTVSLSPFLLGDRGSDSPISSVLSGSKVCKNREQSGAETTQVSSSEVATTALVVTFPLSSARSGSLPSGSPEQFGSWCWEMATVLSLLWGLAASCHPVTEHPEMHTGSGRRCCRCLRSGPFAERWD